MAITGSQVVTLEYHCFYQSFALSGSQRGHVTRSLLVLAAVDTEGAPVNFHLGKLVKNENLTYSSS